MNTNNIILIGMPGAGKSTIGVVLAKKLGYTFIDSDLVIQEKEHVLLHEIISQKGLDGFNEVENKINAQLDVSHSIIATGGSVVYGKEAMQHLSSIGTIIYLCLPFDDLVKRLGDLEERGVSMRPEQTLLDLYRERTPLYEKYADITINCSDISIREIVGLIAKKLNK